MNHASPIRSEPNPATRAELDAALPHVLDAPKDEAPILTLCFRTGYSQRRFPDSLRLTRERGILSSEGEAERWTKAPWMTLEDGSPDPRIQVSILPKRVLDLIWRDRDNVTFPGDTMIADLDTGLANLPAGTLLQAGEAVLRVSDVFNDACVKGKVRHGTDAWRWITAPGHPELRLRGILCELVQDGVGRVGDKLTKVTDSTPLI